MEGFQRTILSIAIVMLLLSLIFIGLSLRKSQMNQTWPPILSSCPDYWTDLLGNGKSCLNVNNLGAQTRACGYNTSGTSNNTIDFTTATYSGAGGACAKKKWATTCSIPNSTVTWDGITYGVGDPCAPTKSKPKSAWF
jgi:hypothetical protein